MRKSMFGFIKKFYIAILCIAIDCVVCKYYVNLSWRVKHHIDWLNNLRRFRVDAYHGLSCDSFESVFGKPFSEEYQDDTNRCGAMWWPSWTPFFNCQVGTLGKDKISLLKMYDDKGRTMYVWYVQDLNGVWRVEKDITPPLGFQ